MEADTDKPGSEAPEVKLASDIRLNRGTSRAAFATLTVDQRVLARITDGIYRRPSSAFRELIANAYDADATEVIIQTDAPRFERIIIRDNGRGMDPEVLANVVYHIGGSTKRTAKGKDFGTVNEADPDLSAGGRRLIGKIGIGLFSIAQLSQHFQIITKRRGDDYRTSADVVLRTYSEEELKDTSEGEKKFETGTVAITSEPASDLQSQGTEIIIKDLRLQAKETLRSHGRWGAAEAALEEGTPYNPPVYHIGQLDLSNSPTWNIGPKTSSSSLAGRGSQSVSQDDLADSTWETSVYKVSPNLPWELQQSPRQKFESLFQKVKGEASVRRNPAVEESLDEYLTTMWRLSLSVPLQYIEKHPFLLTGDDGIEFYKLSEKSRGTAELVQISGQETIGGKLGLQAVGDPVGGFRVFFDDVELLRPITFDRTLHSQASVPRPLMFFGKARSNLGSYAASLGGGPLNFDAYLYWNARIIPKENNGALIRINDASGMPFDETFMDYQVSELNRLAQISSEIFITEGLDAALNIDRESFNFAHPHYQWVQRWLHSSVRQTTNRLKNITKAAGDERKRHAAEQARSALETHIDTVWLARRGTEADQPPAVQIVTPAARLLMASKGEMQGIVLTEREVMPLAEGTGIASAARDRVEALAVVLEAYGLLENLSYKEQEQLIKDILKVFVA